jgi:hypothetical protein
MPNLLKVLLAKDSGFALCPPVPSVFKPLTSNIPVVGQFGAGIEQLSQESSTSLRNFAVKSSEPQRPRRVREVRKLSHYQNFFSLVFRAGLG